MNENLNKKYVQVLPSASQTNSFTRTANIDTLGADYATIIMNFASAINTNGVGPTIKLSESDDTQVTNFATFNSDFNLTSHSIQTQHDVVFHVDTRTRKRYLQLSETTATATNDNVTMGVNAVLGRLGITQPAASSNLGSTNDVAVVG